MKVRQMKSRTGRPVANQFILSERGNGANGNFTYKEIFQSYESIIAERIVWANGDIDTRLDLNFWDYSTTTGKYRNDFLGEGIAETRKKIEQGVYKLEDLNR